MFVPQGANCLCNQTSINRFRFRKLNSLRERCFVLFCFDSIRQRHYRNLKRICRQQGSICCLLSPLHKVPPFLYHLSFHAFTMHLQVTGRCMHPCRPNIHPRTHARIPQAETIRQITHKRGPHTRPCTHAHSHTHTRTHVCLPAYMYLRSAVHCLVLPCTDRTAPLPFLSFAENKTITAKKHKKKKKKQP
jgi:hypothetical protein